MRYSFIVLLSVGLLASCSKPTNHSVPADPCADAKGAPGIETDSQAQQACRDNKKFEGPDAKSSHTKIQNN
jgi:hypothetical protein